MGWVAIIGIILQIFGPLLAKWLGSLFGQASQGMRAAEKYGSPAEGVAALFDAAADELPPLAIVRRGLLAAMKPIAVSRADAIYAKASGEDVVIEPLHEDEVAELPDPM